MDRVSYFSNKSLQYYIVCDSGKITDIPESTIKETVNILQAQSLDISFSDSEKRDSSEKKESKIDYDHYGKSLGLYWIWKNCKADYIGFSFENELPDISKDVLEKALKQGKQAIIRDYKTIDQSLRNDYRDRYYDYDLTVLLSSIKQNNAPMYDCCAGLVNTNRVLPLTIIMRKDVFRRFCVWAFQILDITGENIYPKKSAMQNKYAEHMMFFLVNLYITYSYQKLDVLTVKDTLPINTQQDKYISDPNISVRDTVQDMLNNGLVEQAIVFLDDHNDDADYLTLNKIFKKYNRERRHYKQTFLDTNYDLNNLLKEKCDSNVITTNNKVLVIVWDSFNIQSIIRAISGLGLELDTLFIGNASNNRHSDKWDRVMNFLDSHHYVFVLSTNYFDYISEACYIHETPYFAWTYDSPADMGDLRFVDYDTTHVFMFDSNEVAFYNKQGFYNIHYLPLAADVDEFNKHTLTSEDREKYSAQISFVGQLYTNHLNEYLNYLPDYKKGFINAIIDNNVFRYDTTIVEDLFSRDLREWLDEKAFVEKIIKMEKTDKDLSNGNLTSSMVPMRIMNLIFTTISYRERVMLITMLSNHWNFKLFSNSSHDIFKNTIECGTVDYESEMPLIFRTSKINLNSTVRYIRTGIPLRCMDIMGCGGFLLTNYQRDLDEDFKDGENLAIYRSLEEAYDKCDFYLKNDSIRERIAQNGYELIRDRYNYECQIKKMIDIAGLNHLLGS